MKAHDALDGPIWDDVQRPPESTLNADTRVDVCVVAAGIAGLTTAYLLARQRKAVVVIDDGLIGGGQTHRTTVRDFQPAAK
ncbi:MAG TPA: FAD-dependent oxidoreductase [Pirellulales bacterium]|nr:FAD-dependent oxidoreductase [Pirellulales bacterium]